MAAVHGSSSAVLWDEWDLSTWLSSWTLTKAVTVADVTTFQPGVATPNRSFISGVGEGSLSFEGLFDGGTAGGAGLPDAVLYATLGTDSVVTVGIGGYATVGGAALMTQALQTSYQPRAPVNDAVRFTLNAESNGGVRANGKILQDLAVETTTFNGTNVDNTVSSAFGGVGHLHVTTFVGTTGTCKIQHSPDNSAWADLITFAAVTGVGAQRLFTATPTTTVDRHLRFAITADTFTSMTVACSFSRHRR